MPKSTRAFLLGLAREAGRAILEVYAAGADGAGTTLKADRSPLTEADRRSHVLIEQALVTHGDRLPVISEEGSDAWAKQALPRDYWLVDPLDGTREFLKRTGEFTVNIARVRDGHPVVGIVYAPVTGIAWIGDASGAVRVENNGSREPLRVRPAPTDGALRVVASRDHAGPVVRAMLDRLPDAQTISMGSSLKFCVIAEGRADLYLRDAPTMAWDTAAAQAVLEAAGGALCTLDGTRMAYRHAALRNPHFVAVGDASLPWASLIAPR